MTANVAEVSLGLSGGLLSGVSLRAAFLSYRSGAVGSAICMALLFLVVTGSCGAVWSSSFAWYLGESGWYWLGAGLVVGLATGELTVRWRRRSGSGTAPPSVRPG